MTCDYQPGKRLKSIWFKMKHRCYNSKNDRFNRYGGRGIIICHEWHIFEAFYNWAITHGYESHLTIDRKDNDGIYSPDNCQWITRGAQALNRSTNHLVTIGNVTKNIKQWSIDTGINKSTIIMRIQRGYSDIDIIGSSHKGIRTVCCNE